MVTEKGLRDERPFECSDCNGMNPWDAKKCVHCGATFDEDEGNEPEAEEESEESSSRYETLENIARGQATWASISYGAGVIVGIGGLIWSLKDVATSGLGWNVYLPLFSTAMVCMFFWGIAVNLRASSEMIMLFADMEGNTRKTATLLEKLLERESKNGKH